LTFDWTIAPGQTQGRLYSFLITHETSGEATQGGPPCGFKPLWPGDKIPVANDTKELSSKMCEPGDLR
ncbi:hypothetical protein, partial [Granulicella sp. dw_53]|uniref:hypothetical protein n=1 Tax=Granulicella sp. dw_53 TaxID=2719792 RepID=UPI002102E744